MSTGHIDSTLRGIEVGAAARALEERFAADTHTLGAKEALKRLRATPGIQGVSVHTLEIDGEAHSIHVRALAVFPTDRAVIHLVVAPRADV
jgi:hypothetical protein